MQITKNQLDELLKLIKDPEERKLIAAFFEGKFLNGDSEKLKNSSETNLNQKRVAKKVLDIISRIGIELMKRKTADWFFDLFD